MSHHTRGRKADPRPAADAITRLRSPPKGMGKDAKAEWRRIMPALIARRVLTEADIGAVESYCTAFGDAREARATIAADGAYVTNRLGELKRHPAFTTLREAAGEARRWAAELGITPASRSRVGGSSEEEDSAGAKMGL